MRSVIGRVDDAIHSFIFLENVVSCFLLMNDPGWLGQKNEPTFCPLEVCFIDDGTCFEAIESSFLNESRITERFSFWDFFRILIPEFIDSDRELRSWSVSETFVPFLGVHLDLGTKRAPPRDVVGFLVRGPPIFRGLNRTKKGRQTVALFAYISRPSPLHFPSSFSSAASFRLHCRRTNPSFSNLQKSEHFLNF